MCNSPYRGIVVSIIGRDPWCIDKPVNGSTISLTKFTINLTEFYYNMIHKTRALRKALCPNGCDESLSFPYL